jgi:hypothetical protein
VRSSKEHRWKCGDDVAAFYLSRHGVGQLSLNEASVAGKLKVSPGALRMRRSNFRYLDTGKGLSHLSKQSRKVFERYQRWDERKLRAEAQKYL